VERGGAVTSKKTEEQEESRRYGNLHEEGWRGCCPFFPASFLIVADQIPARWTTPVHPLKTSLATIGFPKGVALWWVTGKALAAFPHPRMFPCGTF
jgi:hypothetical protein